MSTTPSLKGSTRSGKAGGSKTPEISEPLYQVKLLAALRNGDTSVVQSFLSTLSAKRASPAVGTGESGANDMDVAAAALHLAIRCAPLEIVQLMLGHRAISPNAIHPPESKTSALHLAASLGRADVVELLLEQNEIDDTLRDDQGRTCKDVARNKETSQVIQDSRSLLQASYRSLLRSYVLSPPNSPPPASLLDMLSNPRSKLLDLSYIDDATGTTLLHEAARRKDLRLVELAVRAGADLFVRDKKGKTAGESAGKDDRVKVFLRQFSNQDTTLLEGQSDSSPILKGFLNKYTNVAKGYNPRWFVLKDGVLSYYRHREDEDQASRGAISMSSATIRPPSGTDKQRFEISSRPSGSSAKHATAQRWYIKANHPSEASRWVHAIQRSIEWSQTKAKQKETDAISLLSTSAGSASFSRSSSNRGQHRKKESNGGAGGDLSASSSQNNLPYGDDDKIAGSDGTSFSDSADAPPHGDTFELHANSLVAQVELTSKLVDSLSPSGSSPSLSPTVYSSRQFETKAALKESLSTILNLVQTYSTMIRDREDWWKDKLDKERDRAVVWEESLNVVVREGEQLEKELRNTLRAQKKPKRRSEGMWGAASSSPERRPSLIATAPTPTEKDLQLGEITPSVNRVEPITIPSGVVPVSPFSPEAETSAVTTDDEDEFFDAIESNALPGLVVSEPLLSPPAPSPDQSIIVDTRPYESYQKLRTKMPIGSDNRPAISLWSVLKNNIGKDLTRISFPVTFNEPTSMLQRMAEDMEFSECLDAAAAEEDPHRRIAYVAAFAMSNYSSTIGRIAKPFNPMLGETFEYVRLDKRYRYMSEQVSHHPPISACWAEAPSWHYYGEVDAQNKFLGKSFEIRPTGVAHADLILPQDLGPKYPKASGAHNVGKVVEHYTWKKVTTNVSGFLLGSPTIDHYGEMTIINHRTRDKCTLTFKPRGWRGKDAFEIIGRVTDAHNNVKLEIAGRWNSQLVAREVGSGIGALLPDVDVDLPTSGPSSPTQEPRYILLWRNTQKPKSPFNLTPFAITLNDCPDELKSQLCPTDCRLRPDQRAFEMGKYELANVLKIKQEEFQRATRKKRDEGALPPHRPRWFTSSVDEDTRERVWAPSRTRNGDTLEYWMLKEKLWEEARNGKEDTPWPDVDHIFIEDDVE